MTPDVLQLVALTTEGPARILAAWAAPEPAPDDAVQALNAARTMRGEAAGSGVDAEPLGPRTLRGRRQPLSLYRLR